MVAIDRRVDDQRADSVIGDTIDATRLASHHLVEAGHRNVGFVSGPEPLVA
jgi:DNA-binding LacI/PurR family transcriptional regulator